MANGGAISFSSSVDELLLRLSCPRPSKEKNNLTALFPTPLGPIILEHRVGVSSLL